MIYSPFFRDRTQSEPKRSSDTSPLQQIPNLVSIFLSEGQLGDRLRDLPQQFERPQPRAWQRIDWRQVRPCQVKGIEFELFIALLEGITDTEAPIRDYTQASRQYLEPIHPPMAKFVGGRLDATGQLVEIGLWEKEEKRHSPALRRLYRQIAGIDYRPSPHEARPYRAEVDPARDLYFHGFHRIATEYGATCLYLWLMAHCDGSLRTVFSELARDEINHLAKFLGFGLWAYPDTPWQRCLLSLLKGADIRLLYRRDRRSLLGTIRRMTGELHWSRWSGANRSTFSLTCLLVLYRLWQWSRTLTRSQLNALLGENPLTQLD